MAKSTQPGHIIICDASAFRALRCERRRYQKDVYKRQLMIMRATHKAMMSRAVTSAVVG